MDLIVETIDGEPLERDKARSLSKKDKVPSFEDLQLLCAHMTVPCI
jgi:hypothetical protein